MTEALAGPDAAVWHQEADLPDPGAPSRRIESAAAISRFLDILGGHHVRLPRPAAETIDLSLLVTAGFRVAGRIRRLAARVRQGPPPAGPHRKITVARAVRGQDPL